MAERPEDVVFFDGRNSFEAKIGRFKDAVIPNTSTTKDFIIEIESGKYDHLKTRQLSLIAPVEFVVKFYRS